MAQTDYSPVAGEREKIERPAHGHCFHLNKEMEANVSLDARCDLSKKRGKTWGVDVQRVIFRPCTQGNNSQSPSYRQRPIERFSTRRLYSPVGQCVWTRLSPAGQRRPQESQWMNK